MGQYFLVGSSLGQTGSFHNTLSSDAFGLVMVVPKTGVMDIEPVWHPGGVTWWDARKVLEMSDWLRERFDSEPMSNAANMFLNQIRHARQEKSFCPVGRLGVIREE